MNVHKTTKTIRKCGFLNIQFLASFLRSTHPARPSLPASASRPVKIHVGEIKIIRSTGGTHLGGIFRSHPHPPTLVFYHTQKQWSCNQLGDPIWGSFYKNIEIKKRTAENKLPCAEAQRIEIAER